MRKIILTILISLTAICSYGQDRYLTLTDSADAALKREDWARAEQLLQEALREQPGNFTNALLLSNLGVAQTWQGKYQEALKSFEIGLSITPRSTVLLTNRARTLMEMRRYPDALVDLSAALQIDPTLPWPMKMRGLLRLGSNDFQGAEEDFNRLLELTPNDVDALAGLAECAYNRGDLVRTFELYGKAIALAPDDPQLLGERAALYLQQGRPAEALTDLNAAIRVDDSDATLYLYRALANKLLYLNSECEKDKKNAIANGIDPQMVEEFLHSTGR